MEKILAELVAKMSKINDDQADIERDANLNNEGQFTEEQRSQYQALSSMYDQYKAQKDAIEQDMRMLAARAERDGDLKFTLPATRRSQANSASPITKLRSGMPVDREDAETGEHRITFKIPKNIRRVGSPLNFKGTVDGLDAEHRAYRFGMWALAKASRDLPGRYNFEFAQKFVNDYMRPENTAHGETDSTTGGHNLVPDEFSRDIIVLREQYGVVRRLFGRAPMTGDVLHTPKRTGGLTAYFTAQNAAGTESNMTWGDIQLVAKDLMILSRMSNQLSMDAVISIGDTLANEIAYAFSNKEDDCGFNGDGTSTYGGIQGVRTLLTSIDAAGTDSAGLYTPSASTWATLALADFNSTVGLLPQYADTPNACWVCHRAFYYGVMQRLELAAGGVAAMEIAQGDRRPRPLFCGYPVEFAQIMPSATAVSTVSALLGDFSQGALFGDRQQTSIAFSEHGTVGGESVWERNQVAIRGTERFDINVHGCGTSAVVGPIVGIATHA